MYRCSQIIYDNVSKRNRKCKKQYTFILNNCKFCTIHATKYSKIIKIQCLYRGYKARSKIKQLKLMPDDIRVLILNTIKESREKQIYNYFKEKYGDWILYDPGINKNTYFLWLLPLLIFLFGGTIIYKKLIKKI